MNTAELKKIATARELILTLLVVVFVFVAFLNMLYKPKSGELDEVQKQMKDLKLQHTSLVQQIEALKLKQAKQQETRENITNIKISVLKRETAPLITDSVAMIEHIVEVGRKEGLVFDAMSSKSIENKSINRIPFTMKAHGPYKAITQFLKNLDAVPALFVIDSLIITSDPTKNVEASLDAKATLFQVEGINAK